MNGRTLALAGGVALFAAAIAVWTASQFQSPPPPAAVARTAPQPQAQAPAAPAQTGPAGEYSAYVTAEAAAFADAVKDARAAFAAGDTPKGVAAIASARIHYQRFSPVVPFLTTPKPPNLAGLYGGLADLGEVPRGIVIAGLAGAAADVRSRVAALRFTPADILMSAALRLDAVATADAGAEDLPAMVEGVAKAVSLFKGRLVDPALAARLRDHQAQLEAAAVKLAANAAAATAAPGAALDAPATALSADIKEFAESLGLLN
ncbi:MAG: hypothetical protein U1E56_03160 [Bauldia sp.]